MGGGCLPSRHGRDPAEEEDKPPFRSNLYVVAYVGPRGNEPSRPSRMDYEYRLLVVPCGRKPEPPACFSVNFTEKYGWDYRHANEDRYAPRKKLARFLVATIWAYNPQELVQSAFNKTAKPHRDQPKASFHWLSRVLNKLLSGNHLERHTNLIGMECEVKAATKFSSGSIERAVPGDTDELILKLLRKCQTLLDEYDMHGRFEKEGVPTRDMINRQRKEIS